MASPMTYKKMKGFATTDGQQFEWNLAALLYLRGLNSGLDFQLATNVDGAGAMDDVVFRFKPLTEPDIWTTLYVQLKFKFKRPVLRAAVISPKGDFSLPKYFQSYRKINQAMSQAEEGTLLDGCCEKSAFVIFTNAKAGNCLGQSLYGPLCQAEAFVWCGSGKVICFKDNEDILNSFDECGDEGNAFLDRLGMFCEQPNAGKLEAAVRMELGKVDCTIIQGVDSKSLFECFLRHMKVWWEKSNEILHKDHDLLRSAIMEVISHETKNRNSLDLVFEEAVLEKLRDSFEGGCKVCIVQSSESSCRLSLTKLCQAFEGQSLLLDCEGLLANKCGLLTQCRKPEVNIVIICTKGWNSSHQKDYFSIVRDLLAIDNPPRIVFLSNNEMDIVGALTDEYKETVKIFKDEFMFSHLNKASRETVLNKEVSLQGLSTSLSRLLEDASESADKVLDARSVVEISVCLGSLTLGAALGEGIDHYVDRSLELATVVKTSLFQDGTLWETVTIRVMDCDAKQAPEESLRPLMFDRQSNTGLIEKSIHFLSGILGFNHQEKISTIVNELACSLNNDIVDSDVTVGPKSQLGSFDCNLFSLQGAENRPVLALRVRTNKRDSGEACFLFVSDEINDNDLLRVSAVHKSKHLLSLKDGKLRWIKSCEGVECIRPHIDESENEVSKFVIHSVGDIEDRLVLVFGEPGMGKSTLMTRLARGRIDCDSDKHNFAFVIALSDHAQFFADDNNITERNQNCALEFLCSANKIESHLHRSLLKYALEVSGDVVVLFDGFDEIAQKYGEQCCDLVTNFIKDTKVKKIWISSRNSFKNQLEKHFSKFALELCRFDEADQRHFLKEFWKGNSELVLTAEELDTFIDQLLEKTSRAVRDKEKNFMGIPLQTRMLAEVYEDHVTDSKKKTNLPDNLDLLELLEKFVDKKISIYVKDKSNIDQSQVNYEYLYAVLKSVFIESHMNAALGLILDMDTIKSLRMESVIKKSSGLFEKVTRGEVKIGFIDDFVHDKPRFIHRVFAEFFVAKWFSENFSYYPDLIKSKMFTDEFAVVRNIFDRLHAKDFPLHISVINEDIEKVRALLERKDVDVNAKDGGGRTALHLAAGLGTGENMEEKRKRVEILELLIDKSSDFEQVDDILRSSPLQYAYLTESWIAIDRFLRFTYKKDLFVMTSTDITNKFMIDTIFDFDLHNLMSFCIDNGLSVEDCSNGKERLLLRACEKGSLKTASLLIEKNASIYNHGSKVGENNESEEGVSENVEDNTPLHVASENGRIEITELLINKFSVTDDRAVDNGEVNQHDVIAFINHKNNAGDTALHKAAKNGHSQVVTVLINKGADVRALNNNNCTPIHLAAQYRNLSALSLLLKSLDETDRAAALRLCDINGDSVLSLAACGGSLECVKLVVQHKDKCPSDNESSLLAVGEKEGTLGLLSTIPSECRKSTVDFLNLRNKVGKTAIYYAACKGGTDIIKYLISKGGDPKISTHDNRTPLHMAAREKNTETVKAILEALNEEDQTTALNQSDEDGNSVLYNAAYGGCVKCVELIYKRAGKMTQAIGSPLVIAAARGHQLVLVYLLNNFSAEKEGMTKLDFLNARNKSGETAIYLAALNGHDNIIKILISRGGDPNIKAHNNSTPLHMAARRKNTDIVRALLSALKEADGTIAVDQCDEDGNSVLYNAASGGCVKCVDLIFKCGGKMTQAISSPLVIAAGEGHLEVVGYLLNNFSAEKEGMTKLDFLYVRNKNGKTAIHRAAVEGHADIIRILISNGCDTLVRDHNNNTPLHLAARYKHANALVALLETLSEEDRVIALRLGDEDGDSVLYNAAYGGCVKCVDLIYKYGGKMTQAISSPLVIAAERGHEKVVVYLLNNFCAEKEGMAKLDFLNVKNENGKTAIHRAAAKGHADIIRMLIIIGCRTQVIDHKKNSPIHLAARYAHVSALATLLKAHDETLRVVDLRLCDNDGDSVLSCAAHGGSLECVKLIVQHIEICVSDFDRWLVVSWKKEHQEFMGPLSTASARDIRSMEEFLNLRNKAGKTAIYYAACKGQTDIINYLISKGGDPKISTHDNRTPLHMAALEKHTKTVETLLAALKEEDRATALNQCDEDGDSVLYNAAYGGCVKCVDLIFKSGGKMTQAIGSPLVTAAGRGHQEVVVYLLDNFNAEKEDMTKLDFLNVRNKNGESAIYLAAQNGHTEIVKILISQGGDPSIKAYNNSTPLHVAVRRKNTDIVIALLVALNEANRPTAVHQCDEDGNSLLYNAAYGGCVECVDLIFQCGGNMTQAISSPLVIAAGKGHLEVVLYLLDNFSAENEGMTKLDFLNVRNNKGETAIHRAAAEGHTDIISFLISQGCDALVDDFNNNTPIHLAARHKHSNALAALLDTLSEEDQAFALRLCDENGDSVLYNAVYGGCVNCVELIYKRVGKMTQAISSLLVIAAERGHQEVVVYLLDNFSAEKEGMTKLDFLNVRNKNGKTAIYCAALKGHTDIVNILFSKGGDPNIIADNNNTLLHTVARWKHTSIVRALLAALNEADRTTAVHQCDEDGDSVLYNAAYGGCVECVDLIFKCGGKMTQAKTSSLVIAAGNGHLEAVIYLLNNFCAEKEGMTKLDFVNFSNKFGKTAIHQAAMNGHTDIVHVLISYGGSTKILDDHNATPIHLAAKYNHPDALRILLETLDEAGRADVFYACDNDGHTALMCCAWAGYMECVNLLLLVASSVMNLKEAMVIHFKAMASSRTCVVKKSGLKTHKPQTRDPWGSVFCAENKSVLHRVAKTKLATALDISLSVMDKAGKESACNVRDEKGNNVLMNAALGGSLECVKIAVEAGCNFCQGDNDNRTSLMHASVGGYAQVVDYLLSVYGDEREGVIKLAYIDMADKDGKTALDLAGAECRDVIKKIRDVAVSERTGRYFKFGKNIFVLLFFLFLFIRYLFGF